MNYEDPEVRYFRYLKEKGKEKREKMLDNCVIRCRDCKHYYSDYVCILGGAYSRDNDYCSHGERRTEWT